MDIISTSMTVDCASLQGCTAACFGLKMTEEQWLLCRVCAKNKLTKKGIKRVQSSGGSEGTTGRV